MSRTILGALACTLAATLAPVTVTAAATPSVAGPASTNVAAVADPGGVPDPNTHSDTPRTGIYWNNPIANTKHVQRLYIDRFQGAARNSVVRVMTWHVTDTAVARAMREAWDRRSVEIRVITSKANCDDVTDILGFLAHDGDGSWVKCVKDGHGMHQKSYIFEETGGVRNVVLVGSSNMTTANWDKQFNDMFQYAGRADIYGWYLNRFQKIHNNITDPWSVPAKSETDGERARAEFLPIREANPTRSDDPIWVRLNNLPASPRGHETEINIAMYAMDYDTPRSAWLREKLANMVNAGAIIRFIAGPAVRDATIDALHRSGVKVRRGWHQGRDSNGVPCRNTDSDCARFVHLKLMTAKYWETPPGHTEPIWNNRSYTGSHNWSDHALTDDFDVTQRMGGIDTRRGYNQLFEIAWDHYTNHWN